MLSFLPKKPSVDANNKYKIERIKKPPKGGWWFFVWSCCIADVKNTLTYGDVDFDQSNVPFKKGKLYIIEGKTVKNQEIILKVVNYENKAVLEEIIKK